MLYCYWSSSLFCYLVVGTDVWCDTRRKNIWIQRVTYLVVVVLDRNEGRVHHQDMRNKKNRTHKVDAFSQQQSIACRSTFKLHALVYCLLACLQGLPTGRQETKNQEPAGRKQIFHVREICFQIGLAFFISGTNWGLLNGWYPIRFRL